MLMKCNSDSALGRHIYSQCLGVVEPVVGSISETPAFPPGFPRGGFPRGRTKVKHRFF